MGGPEVILLTCEHCDLEHKTVKRRRFSPYDVTADNTPLCPDCWQDVTDIYQRGRMEM